MFNNKLRPIVLLTVDGLGGGTDRATPSAAGDPRLDFILLSPSGATASSTGASPWMDLLL